MATRKASKTSRLARAAACGVIALGLTCAGVAGDLLWLYPDRPCSPPGETVDIEIPRGVGPSGLAAVLQNSGVLGSPRKFAAWLRLTGGMKHVRSGHIEVQRGMTPRQLLAAASRAGREFGLRVTIPEGFTVRRIAGALEEAKVARASDVVDLAVDHDYLRELGLDTPTLEGYLFPDTYYFRPDQGARSVLRTMVRTLERRLVEGGIDPQHVDPPTLTLASIVQSEARFEDEMPIIAGVYRNRLFSPNFPSRLLQADPTVSYGCEPLVGPVPSSCRPFSGTLTRRQLDDPSNAHNTYVHKGLPPTPICSPGLAAIRAAVSPAQVPFFYFVAERDSGRHVFSATLTEHNEAVRRYRASRQ